MTYDATDPDADGVVEADVDNESVSTDEVQFGGDIVTKDTTIGPDYDDHANNGGYNAYNWGIVFETDRQVHLTNVTIDANYAGDLTIELRPFNAGSGIGSVIDSYTATVEQGRQRLDIDITVPDQTQEWWLGRADADNTPLHRDNTSAVSYPYSTGPMTITSGAFEDGTTNSTYFSYFDIGIEWEGGHTASMSQTGRAVDLDGNDIDSVESVSANRVNVETSVTYPDEWQETGQYGPSELNTTRYRFSHRGLVISPNEDIKLTDATINAETSGTLTVDIYKFNDGQRPQNYPSTGDVARHTFEVDAGEQTISFDQRLDSLESYDGYHLCINNSDVALSENMDIEVPIDLGFASLYSAKEYDGALIDGYRHFYDLTIEHGTPKTPIYSDVDNPNTVYGSFERINNTYRISDQSINDIGARLQSIVDECTKGDVIKIGQGIYSVKTTCVIDKTIHITSDGKSQHGGQKSGPIVELENDDTPFIRVEDGRPSFTGLNLSCQRSGVATNGILFHSRAIVDNCTAEGFSSVPFYFHDAAEQNYNLNGIITNNVCGHNIGADLIRLESSGSDPKDINACDIDVGTYTGDGSGYAINDMGGFGNTYSVQHVEGSGMQGALRIGDNGNRGYVGYIENPEHIVTFADSAHRNYVEVNYNHNIATPVVWNEGGGSNWGNRVEWTAGRTIEHQDNEPALRSETFEKSDLIFGTNGKGPIIKSSDGTQAARLALNNDGTLNLESLDATQF